ncbi:MAG: hypothetical protein IIC49_03555 [Planctomycetes bacterium]|nr:hypothetical protein [Planctomycetota bacterium]
MSPRTRTTRRGGILLEVMLALALLVMGSMAILSAMSQSIHSLEATRLKQQAADLARSAMARIEAGIATPETLQGPVPAWESDPESGADELNDGALPDEFGLAATVGWGEDSGWELEIDTSPSPFAGLAIVRVRALRRASADSDRIMGQYTLEQLVRLGTLETDEAGAEDELMEAARQGIAQERRRTGPGGGP